jgi:phage FluMu gp28-like protein
MDTYTLPTCDDWPQPGPVAASRPGPTAVPRPKIAPSVSDWAAQHLGFLADPVQSEILNSHTHRLILCCTRQWGKSSIAAIKALHIAAHKPGAFILFAAASLNQAAELLRCFRKFAATLGQAKVGASAIHLPNGSRILAVPQSPATVRCYAAVDVIVIDEAAFVIDEMYDALSPMLATSNGQLWLLSSANGTTGEFHKTWTKQSKLWQKYKVTADECPRISRQFLASEKESKGDTIYNREYMCQFTAGAGGTINPSDIRDAFRGDYPAMRFDGKKEKE